MRHNYLFTSESVTEGHPVKIADQISDGILDHHAQESTCRVACETILTTGIAFVAGEISPKPTSKFQTLSAKHQRGRLSDRRGVSLHDLLGSDLHSSAVWRYRNGSGLGRRGR